LLDQPQGVMGHAMARIKNVHDLSASLAFLLVCGLGGCGTRLGVIPFSAAGRGQASMVLDARSDVRFWTDFRATHPRNLSVEYDVELIQDGVTVAGARCDPAVRGASRVCWVRTDQRINCQMQCSVRISKTGPTLVRATLYIGGDPLAQQLERADLIVKQ
jgi:hypothetical protein